MIKAKLREIAARFRAQLNEAEFESLNLRSHVFPRYRAPVIRIEEGERWIRPMHFGLIPFFEKNAKPKKVFHNARVETVREKPSFKRSFEKRRILVPMNSFFEHIWTSDTDHWLAQIQPQNGDILLAAGIWDAWKGPEQLAMPLEPPQSHKNLNSPGAIESFAIITREPYPFVQKLGHDRSPFFLTDAQAEAWLASAALPTQVAPQDFKCEKP